MIKALQKKFVIMAMSAVSMLLIVLIGGINLANGWITVRQIDQQLAMLSDTEGGMAKHKKPKVPPGGFLDPPMDEDTAMSLRFFIVFIDEDGQVLHKDISRISSVNSEQAEEFAAKAAESGKQTGYVETFKYQAIAAGQNRDFEYAQVYIFLDVSRHFRSIFKMFALSVSIAVLCWLFMLLIVIWLSRRAIRPIAQNIQKQKQFVTDAGHEIKTPLAIIQANIDAMELIHGENKWSRNIKNQTLRLNGLMQDLLTLAKMEEAGLQLPMEDLDISRLFNETLMPFYEAAALRGIFIEAQIQPDLWMRAGREHIQRLFSILFDNAVKYAEAGGTIHVDIQKSDQNIMIQVQNTCTQLPQTEADRLFDRFYRGDSARTQKNGGYGIGLSAAYAIVTAHRGNITAKYIDDHTILFQVSFSKLNKA